MTEIDLHIVARMATNMSGVLDLQAQSDDKNLIARLHMQVRHL